MNALLYLAPPAPRLTAESPLSGLPSSAAEPLRGTPYAAEVSGIAKGILGGRIPLLGTSVQFDGGIRWRRDPVHGHELGAGYFRRIPYLDFEQAGDHKFVWELNRHQHLVLMAQAWSLEPKPEYLALIERQLRDWREQNPFQRGMNWTSALEVAFRAWSWIWIWHLCGRAMPGPAAAAHLQGLYQHARHLEQNLSVYFSPNTHLLGEAVVLHALGTLFPDWPGAAQRRRMGLEEVNRQAERQELEDGAHFELSTYDHVYALDMLMAHCLIEYKGPGPHVDLLRRMARFLHAVQLPDRRLPLIGDDDGGRFFHPFGVRRQFGRATLATASLLLGGDEFPFEAEDAAVQAAWWMGGECAGRSAPGRPAGAARFAASGLVRLGDGVNAHVLFDAGGFGPFRAGHSHSDALQVTLWAGGEEILVDPATYTYISDPAWRDRFRGSAAHNTVRIDGQDQAKAAGPFAWEGRPQVTLKEWSESRAAAVCRCGNFVHHRAVILSRDWLLVTDTVEGPSGEHEVEQFWHLARPELAGRVRVPDGEGMERLEGGDSGWLSETLGSKSPGVVLRRSRKGTLPVRWQTAISLTAEGPSGFPASEFDGDGR